MTSSQSETLTENYIAQEIRILLRRYECTKMKRSTSAAFAKHDLKLGEPSYGTRPRNIEAEESRTVPFPTAYTFAKASPGRSPLRNICDESIETDVFAAERKGSSSVDGPSLDEDNFLDRCMKAKIMAAKRKRRFKVFRLSLTRSSSIIDTIFAKRMTTWATNARPKGRVKAIGSRVVSDATIFMPIGPAGSNYETHTNNKVS